MRCTVVTWTPSAGRTANSSSWPPVGAGPGASCCFSEAMVGPRANREIVTERMGVSTVARSIDHGLLTAPPGPSAERRPWATLSIIRVFASVPTSDGRPTDSLRASADSVGNAGIAGPPSWRHNASPGRARFANSSGLRCSRRPPGRLSAWATRGMTPIPLAGTAGRVTARSTSWPARCPTVGVTTTVEGSRDPTSLMARSTTQLARRPTMGIVTSVEGSGDPASVMARSTTWSARRPAMGIPTTIEGSGDPSSAMARSTTWSARRPAMGVTATVEGSGDPTSGVGISGLRTPNIVAAATDGWPLSVMGRRSTSETSRPIAVVRSIHPFAVAVEARLARPNSTDSTGASTIRPGRAGAECIQGRLTPKPVGSAARGGARDLEMRSNGRAPCRPMLGRLNPVNAIGKSPPSDLPLTSIAWPGCSVRVGSAKREACRATRETIIPSRTVRTDAGGC